MTVRPIRIRGARVIDPTNGIDAVLDVRLQDGAVAEVGADLAGHEDDRVIEAKGQVVCPGLIDIHVHLREPGGEHKETVASGARAAAAGGFTAICAMPNTTPAMDCPAIVGYVVARGKEAAAARVYPVGTISVGREGKQLAEFGAMVDAGAVAFTDDGSPVMDSQLMRRALEYAQSYGVPIADHPEDLYLSGDGSMNEGPIATRLGLKGKPNASEDVHIVRDLMLSELTGGHIHLQHVSTRDGVDAIRRAKERGVRVTAEASPHHLILTDDATDGYRTDAKMNPPLRSEADRDAVREAFRDGTLDTLATDHAPHHPDEKERPFAEAPFGIVGLETALGLMLTHVVAEGLVDLPTLIERMTVAPARAFQLPGGSLSVGALADVTVFDPEAEWTVDPERFHSLSRNTPFAGWTLRGRATHTIVGGAVVWEGDGSE